MTNPRHLLMLLQQFLVIGPAFAFVAVTTLAHAQSFAPYGLDSSTLHLWPRARWKGKTAREMGVMEEMPKELGMEREQALALA